MSEKIYLPSLAKIKFCFTAIHLINVLLVKDIENCQLVY